ncbi:hypothetical protein RvY_08444 [Ramazzottius varieornatus]|uniref:Uncharacterized protein n=1 Tax=Ramazzottius varieornatus TaxID=947166 RepID=A0A1D1V5T5_RAMVA|nr:hypothetical protein RvY_08444 [Ramazzottius varieornatus]
MTGVLAFDIAVNIVLFDLPVVLMCFVYPFILSKVLTRSRSKAFRINPSVPDVAQPAVARSSRHRSANAKHGLDPGIPRATLSPDRDVTYTGGPDTATAHPDLLHTHDLRLPSTRNVPSCCSSVYFEFHI